MPKKIKVAILDHHQATVDEYLYYLKTVPEIEVVVVINFGRELEPELAAHPADVLIFDVGVPTAQQNAGCYPILNVIPKLLQTYPKLIILAITMFTGRRLIQAVMEAGASGYILKDDQTLITKLGVVIRAATIGGMPLSQSVQRLLLQCEPDSNKNQLGNVHQESLLRKRPALVGQK